MSRAILALALACVGAVQGAAVRASDDYADDGVRIAVEASARVVLQCGQMRGYGSAVAVAPDRAVTARHVADMLASCPEPDAKAWLVKHDGSMFLAKVVDYCPDADCAMLAPIFAGDRPFHTWARLAAAEARQGDPVWLCAGASFTDGQENFNLKKGYAGRYGAHPIPDYAKSRVLYVSAAVVAGNSGGGVFTARGELLGVVSAGQWQVGDEKRGIATAASELAALLARDKRR